MMARGCTAAFELTYDKGLRGRWRYQEEGSGFHHGQGRNRSSNRPDRIEEPSLQRRVLPLLF